MASVEFTSLAGGTVLVAHAVWIVWVILGVFWTRNRPLLTWFHIASLVWGIVVELGPWECPLTLLEQFFKMRVGVNRYQGGFIVHCLDEIVYPDLPRPLVAWVGAGICGVNLIIYAHRYWKQRRVDLQQYR